MRSPMMLRCTWRGAAGDPPARRGQQAVGHGPTRASRRRPRCRRGTSRGRTSARSCRASRPTRGSTPPDPGADPSPTARCPGSRGRPGSWRWTGSRSRRAARRSPSSRRCSEMLDAPMKPRSLVSADMPTIQPAFSGPSRHRSRDPHVGEEHLVELGVAVHLAQAVGARRRREAMSSRKNEMPLWGGSLGVGAGHEDAAVGDPPVGAPDLLAVDDVARHRRGRPGWRAPARSDPASGSENSWHQIRSPVMIGRRCSACCSGVPNASSAEPVSTQPTMLRNAGTCGEGALGDPGRVVLGRQSPAAELDRPVDPGETGLEQARLPGPALVREVGRQDRAVVARRERCVVGQPRPSPLLELLQRLDVGLRPVVLHHRHSNPLDSMDRHST